MDQQSYVRDFMRYTILSVLGTLGVSCYILADTFFISKGLGTKGLAALNLAIPVYNFIHGTGLMLGMGGATRFSVCKSQGKGDEVDRIYMNTLYLAVVSSAVFAVLGIVFSNRLAVWLGADETVLVMTETYLRWLLMFSPAFILNDVLLCFVRNDDSPQLSMAAMVTGSFANILLDYIFIFPMKMGIFGAVLATGMSPVISVIMMLPHWIRRKNTFHFIKTGGSRRIAGQELSLGFPSLLSQVSTGIVMIVFNGIILGLKGNTGVAAYGVIANIALVVTAVYTGIAQGVQPLISSFYGRGDGRQSRLMLRYAVGTMAAVSCVLYGVLFVFAGPVTAVFNSERDGTLQMIAEQGLKLYFLSSWFVGYNTILATFFTSVEKALPAHILSVLRGFVLIIPGAFALSALWGITGVWLAYPVVEGTVALMGYVVYRRRKDGEPV